ncbi:unnamed protein product [Caretta caretta]
MTPSEAEAVLRLQGRFPTGSAPAAERPFCFRVLWQNFRGAEPRSRKWEPGGARRRWRLRSPGRGLVPGQGGGLAAAPDLAGHEALQRFLVENQDLKEAIRQSNQMLRQRYQGVPALPGHTAQEKEFLMLRFRRPGMWWRS